MEKNPALLGLILVAFTFSLTANAMDWKNNRRSCNVLDRRDWTPPQPPLTPKETIPIVVYPNGSSPTDILIEYPLEPTYVPDPNFVDPNGEYGGELDLTTDDLCEEADSVYELDPNFVDPDGYPGDVIPEEILPEYP
jgi:hypothetical protein